MAYTESKAIQGIGMVLAIGAAVGGSGSPVPVFEVTDSPVKPATWDKNEVTNFNSPNRAKEFRKGLIDGGTISLKGSSITDDPGQIAMDAAFADKDNPYSFTITMPKAPGQATSGDVYAFSALVMSWGPLATLSPAKTVEFECELQITGGRPVKTAGS